jgi:calcineurin-like phosphoesterase family protein
MFDNRPFKDLIEMRETMIQRHNEIVNPNDTVYHLGDFNFNHDPDKVQEIVRRLNGNNIFIKGSHDYWLPANHPVRLEVKITNSVYIILDHYQMTSWPRSHHGSFQFYGRPLLMGWPKRRCDSFQFYGHSHGRSTPRRNQIEVFCGDYNYAPVELDVLIDKIKSRPDYAEGVDVNDHRNNKQ